MDRYQVAVTACLIFIKDDKVLLSRRFNTGWNDGQYDLPSGHIEAGETVREAGAREAKEEVAVTILPTDLKLVHMMHRHGEKADRIECFLRVEKWDGEPFNNEPDKCDDVQWFPLNGLPSNMIAKAKQALEQSLAGSNYSEFNWEK
jgi:mutator protein MutT